MKKASAAAEAFNIIGQVSIAAQTILQNNVVRTTLNNTGCGYARQFCRIAELRQRQRTAVAHRAANLSQRRLNIILERTGVRHIGVNAFLKGELAGTAQIIPLPVAGTVGTFTPIPFIVGTIDFDLVRRALIETGEE